MPNFMRADYGIREAQADTAAPTNGVYDQMDLVENSSPAVGLPIGWICTTSGSPGTWQPLPNLLANGTVTALAAAGTISIASGLVDIDTGGFAVTVTAPTAAQGGARIPVVNNTASPVTFVAGSGGGIIAGSLVLSANTSTILQSSGTNWYRTA
jgi:hypothetical protein